MPEDTNEKTPILLLKKLLEGKQPPPDRGADGPLTTKGVQSREFAQREQKAKELKSTQENKGPKPEMDAKPKAEAIADKYKEELVRSGVPLSIEKKLQIIEHEVPAAKTDTLKQQFDDLKKEINSQPQSPDSRNRIETIIKGIPADVYTDKDLADIAREIKQTAYGHIMRNKAYMVGASIEDRVQMGETFKDAKSSRIYEDENYLRDIGENILHRPLTTADIQAEVQVSEDLVKHLNAGGDEADVDLVVKTMRPVEKLDEKTARQKIAEGPKWAQDAAGNITRDSHALSFLGEISDVYKINPDLVDDPTKLNPSLLFTKGIQLRVDSADFYASQGGSPDVLVQMQEGASVRDAVVEQVKLTIEGRPMFTSDRWDEHLYLMSEPKAFALGTGFSALWDPIADPTDALDPNDPREAELMKELRGFNNYTQGMTNPDLYDRELLSLFHKINFDCP